MVIYQSFQCLGDVSTDTIVSYKLIILDTFVSVNSEKRKNIYKCIFTINKIHAILNPRGDVMTVSENIRNLRKQNGITQKELAKRSGIAEITIRKYENNDRQPKIEQIEKIAKALEVLPVDIMGVDYFDKKIDSEKTSQRIKFIQYIESIGYEIQDDKVTTEWDENPDGTKYPISFDESPDAPFCTLVKGEVISAFTNQQFEDYQKAMTDSAEYHAFKYRK